MQQMHKCRRNNNFGQTIATYLYIFLNYVCMYECNSFYHWGLPAEDESLVAIHLL